MTEKQNTLAEDQDIIKNTDIDISEAQLSGVSESQDELNLDDIDTLKVERRLEIFKSETPYEFSDNERVDVFIKNYMSKFDMKKSLKIFEQEFFEYLSKGLININDLQKVPYVYIESERIQEELGTIQKELDDAKIYAEKAKSLFLRLHRAKENEKIKHRRVQQEKQKLMKDIDKKKRLYETDNKLYKELKKKYWEVTNNSLLLENDQTKLKSSFAALKEQEEKLKRTLDEAKKQRERDLT